MNTEWTMDEEAEALHRRFNELKVAHIGQAEFARKWGVPGGASMVSQHIKARRPISLEAATAYAAGFGCSISDISPRLAKTISKATHTHASFVTASPPENQPNVAVTHVQKAHVATNDVASLNQVLDGLSAHLGQADDDTRTAAAGLLAAIAKQPDNASMRASLAALLTPSGFAEQKKKAA